MSDTKSPDAVNDKNKPISLLSLGKSAVLVVVKIAYSLHRFRWPSRHFSALNSEGSDAKTN
jgi:hypothetical protein